MDHRLWIGLVAAVATLVVAAAAPAVDGPPSAPRFAALLAGAPLAVSGRVARVQSFDHDRVRVIDFVAEKVLKGAERLASHAGPIEIVEMRDHPSAPSLLDVHDHAVVFLGSMPRGSYLDATLGVKRRWQARPGRGGVIADRDATVAREVASLVERLADRSRAPAGTAEEREALRRAWTFDALQARHEAAVEDGAAELAGLPRPAGGLAPEERHVLESALQRGDLSPRVRAALVDAIARARLVALRPALERLPESDALVLGAAWRARAALGAPPGRDDVERALRSSNPAVRALAATTFATAWPDETVARMDVFLPGESEPQVRIAVLAALGGIPGEAARELVENAFVEESDPAIRAAAGRALFERGGDEAAESLMRLAFAAPPEVQRQAVVLLLALGRPADDPLVARVREKHPDEAVRELAEHGLSDGHH